MNNFTNELKELTKRVETLKDSLNTEEATKTALIMPFFQLLGYDVFNPLEFTPEFTADYGIKKGEKVDYAIIQDGNPVILIECKSVNEKLNKHDSQLFRYFATTTSKFGVLTNGIEYKFYTDLEEKNKMDKSPFLTINLLKLRETQIPELYKFTKEQFEIDNISQSAYELKYISSIKNFLNEEWENPSENFIKFILSFIYDGVKTKQVVEKFTPLIKETFDLFLNEQVNIKLNAALNRHEEVKEIEQEEKADSDIIVVEKPQIITTQEELEAFAVIKVLLSDVIDVERIYYRDNHSYFNILLDDNIRKWVCRLWLNKNKKYIKFYGDNNKIQISDVMDLIKYKKKLLEIVKKFN